ncbi:MAG: hypothetical protein E7310_07065 [Clostridiales bacterium]|nr:hypothetical protein [Clostridiales bacterium]
MKDTKYRDSLKLLRNINFTDAQGKDISSKVRKILRHCGIDSLSRADIEPFILKRIKKQADLTEQDIRDFILNPDNFEELYRLRRIEK